MVGYFDLIIGISIIVYVISLNIINSATTDFSIFFIGIGFLLILFHFLKDYLEHKRYFRIMKKYVIVILSISLFIFMAIEAFIIGFPKINKENTDYIIILGDGTKNGNNISQTLRDRLDTAVKSVYTDGNNGYIVISSGQSKNEDIPEADVMERYLIDQGIPKNKIIKENKSKNTYENFKYSKTLIEKHSGKTIDILSVKVVTTDLYALRSYVIASKFGYKDLKFNTSSTIFYFVPAYYTREPYELIKCLLY